MLVTTLALTLPFLFAQEPALGIKDDIHFIAPKQEAMLETKHYILHMDGTGVELEEQADLMEAAFEGFAEVLGKKPRIKRGDKTLVRIFANKRDWRAGLDLEQEVPPPRVDFVHYSPQRRTVYVYGEPRSFWLRKWLLFGMFQDFHWNLKAKNQYLDLEWYITGMADALSTHTWDGETLELAAHLALPDNNRGNAAVQRGALEKIEDGEISNEDLGDWDVRWAMTCFLMYGNEGQYWKKFARLALGSRGSMVVGNDLLPLVGDTKTITAEVAAWLKNQARTLSPYTGAWDEDGAALRGRAGKGELGFAVADEATNTLEVTVKPGGRVRVGVLLDWIDRDHFTVAGITDDTIYIEEFSAGSLQLQADYMIKTDKTGRCTIKMVRDAQSVILSVGGTELDKIPVKSRRFGLSITEGIALFEQLSWK